MKFLTVLIIIFALLTACSAGNVQTTHLNVSQANDMINQKEQSGLFVLNVHTPFEGTLAGTDQIIEDWEHISAHLDQLPKNKHTPILVYCRSGRMSASAVEQLETLGYANIYHLDGGMRAWADAGLPIENKTFE